MICPNPDCDAEMDEPTRFTGKHWCRSCGLEGPRDVLEALAARLAPAGVLAEAERLLREAGVYQVRLMWPSLTLATPPRDVDHVEALTPSACAVTVTLAEAYSKLVKETP